MKKILLICLLLLPCRFIKAQINLVPNPSFEIIDTPCIRGGGINFWLNSHMVGWWPVRNTSDYFTDLNNICTDWPNQMNQFAQPSNLFTYNLPPATGNKYAGACSFNYNGIGSENYREQIQCKLIAPMIVNHYYQVKFKIAFCSHRNRYRAGTVPPKASTNLGIKFTNQRYRYNLYSNIYPNIKDTIPSLNLSPDIKPSKQISDTTWVEVSGIFKADSAYNYLILGGFGLDATIDTITIPNGLIYDSMRLVRKEGCGYYFFDDLSVMEIDTVFSQLQLLEINSGLLLFVSQDNLNVLNITQNSILQIDNIMGSTIFKQNLEPGNRTINLKEIISKNGVYIISVLNSKNAKQLKYLKNE